MVLDLLVEGHSQEHSVPYPVRNVGTKGGGNKEQKGGKNPLISYKRMRRFMCPASASFESLGAT